MEEWKTEAYGIAPLGFGLSRDAVWSGRGSIVLSPSEPWRTRFIAIAGAKEGAGEHLFVYSASLHACTRQQEQHSFRNLQRSVTIYVL